jgi:hypothetical protein
MMVERTQGSSTRDPAGTGNVLDHQAIYDIFENLTSGMIKRDEFGRKYIEWITDALKLREGLPS